MVLLTFCKDISTKFMKTLLLNAKDNKALAIHQSVIILQEGGIIAFPTETVYGLGSDIFNPQACLEIFKAKERPADSPLSAHISNLSQVELVAKSIPREFELLAEKFMPGPIGIILQKKDTVPMEATANGFSIGIRFPNEETCIDLINSFGSPLAATSANRSGRVSPTNAHHVLDDLDGRIPAIIDGGDCKFKIESTVISLIDNKPKILRNGVITKEEIEDALSENVDFVQSNVIQKYKHYSPNKKVLVFNDIDEMIGFVNTNNINYFAISNENIAQIAMELQKPLQPTTFYDYLRYADKTNADIIIIYLDEISKQNAALNERITAISKY